MSCDCRRNDEEMSFDETRLSSRDLRVISAPVNRDGIAEISGREGRALRTFVSNSDLTDRSVEKIRSFRSTCFLSVKPLPSVHRGKMFDRLTEEFPRSRAALVMMIKMMMIFGSK